MPKYHEEDPFDLLAAVGDVASLGSEGIRLIEADQVTENSPYQTRVDLFDPTQYAEDRDLARSILEAGRLLPHLAVVVAEAPGGLTLLAGHRRYYALRWLLTAPEEEIRQTLDLASFHRPSSQVPAYLIENPDPRTVFEITIVENLHRRDLHFSELAVQIAKYHQALPRGEQGKAHRTFGLKQAMYYRYLQVGRKLLAEGYDDLPLADKRRLLRVSGAVFTQWARDYPQVSLAQFLQLLQAGAWPPPRHPASPPSASVPAAPAPASGASPTARGQKHDQASTSPGGPDQTPNSSPAAQPVAATSERQGEPSLTAFAQAHPWARRFERTAVQRALQEAQGHPAWVVGWLLIAWALGVEPEQWPPKRARVGIEDLLEHLLTKEALW